MKWILLSLILVFCFNTKASVQDLSKAPQNFVFENKLAVYSDFQMVTSQINFDLTNKKAKVISHIKFKTEVEGFALFDLVPNIDHAFINSKVVSIKTIAAPKGETKYRYIDTLLPMGSHELVIENEISINLQFKKDYVSFAMWMSDLSDREYIEQYLPTNLEYDQYTLNLDLNIISEKSTDQHSLYTNGEVITKGPNSFSIRFPSYFTSSSFYLHLTKKDRFPSEHFEFLSLSGKKIPITLYARSSWSISGVKNKIENILTSLEKDFGAWPHPTLTVYIAGLGGMEHSGATVTSEDALAHELTHSYFARGVMPLNGNAGWMDEAIASWRDNGYPKVNAPNFSSTSMSSHSEYRRFTDQKAYKEGASFMAFLNFRLESAQHTDRNFLSFLKDFHTRYTHKNISTELFQQELEDFSGENFTQEFNQYIFGNRLGHQDPQPNESPQNGSANENPYHPRLTRIQLESLL